MSIRVQLPTRVNLPSHTYAPICHAINNAIPRTDWLSGSIPAATYWSAGRQIFFQGKADTAPSYFDVMRGLGENYQVYRMEALRGGFLVFDRPWLERASGDLHAQLAKDEDAGFLKLIRAIEEKNGGRVKTPALHHTEPMTPFHPQLRGFDIYEWMNRPKSLAKFERFLNRHPTLARVVERSLPFVTEMDLAYLEKILSSMTGSFEGETFVFSGSHSEGILKNIIGVLAEFRLRERVFQDYQRVTRTIDPQAILLLKPEIFRRDGRKFADALIARIGPKDRQMFLMGLYELSLSETLASQKIQAEQARWDSSEANREIVVQTAEGRWEIFEGRGTPNLEFVSYGLPEEEHADVRREARQILEEAIFALEERSSVTMPPQRAPQRLPRIQTQDPYDFFRQMGWETVEQAWGSGNGGRILVALVRWISFQIWQGIPPMVHGGKTLRTVSFLGVSEKNVVRQFIEQGVSPGYFTRKKIPHKHNQEQLVQFLVMGGLSEERAREFVGAVYWMEWGWEPLSQTKIKGLFLSYFVALVRNAAFKLWGGHPPHNIRRHVVIKGVQREGVSRVHPIRSLLDEAYILEKNLSRISLKDYQNDIAKVLALAGISETEAKKRVRELYYYLWGWESVETALASGDARRILAAYARDVSYVLWGGVPPGYSGNKQITGGVRKEGAGISHPLRRLLKEGAGGWRITVGRNLSVENYKKDLENLLTWGGMSQDRAHQVVEDAFR